MGFVSVIFTCKLAVSDRFRSLKAGNKARSRVVRAIENWVGLSLSVHGLLLIPMS